MGWLSGSEKLLNEPYDERIATQRGCHRAILPVSWNCLQLVALFVHTAWRKVQFMHPAV